MGARDALSLIVIECYINVMLCSDLLYDHAIALISDSDGERRAAVLAHSLQCLKAHSVYLSLRVSYLLVALRQRTIFLTFCVCCCWLHQTAEA